MSNKFFRVTVDKKHMDLTGPQEEGKTIYQEDNIIVWMDNIQEDKIIIHVDNTQEDKIIPQTVIEAEKIVILELST